MWRAYQRRTRKRLSRAAFYKRINKTLGNLIRWILDTLIQRARANKPRYTGLLEGFKDVVAAGDASAEEICTGDVAEKCEEYGVE